MAQRDSACQEESIGTTLVLNKGDLTPKQQGLLQGGGSVIPSRGVLGALGAWGLALCFLPPHPWSNTTTWDEGP